MYVSNLVVVEKYGFSGSQFRVSNLHVLDPDAGMQSDVVEKCE